VTCHAPSLWLLAIASMLTPSHLPAAEIHEIAGKLVEFEGFRSEVYRCPRGFPTIGFGHRCRVDHPPVDERAALDTLLVDVREANDSARRLVPNLDDLPTPAQHAVVHMIFQLGAKGFYEFANLRKALEKQDFKAASREALASRWANQTPVRAQYVARLFLESKQ
jgi:lysozyme